MQAPGELLLLLLALGHAAPLLLAQHAARLKRGKRSPRGGRRLRRKARV